MLYNLAELKIWEATVGTKYCCTAIFRTYFELHMNSQVNYFFPKATGYVLNVLAMVVMAPGIEPEDFTTKLTGSINPKAFSNQ